MRVILRHYCKNILMEPIEPIEPMEHLGRNGESGRMKIKNEKFKIENGGSAPAENAGDATGPAGRRSCARQAGRATPDIGRLITPDHTG
jgi:hypothetical protein